jgi:tyrosinase
MPLKRILSLIFVLAFSVVLSPSVLAADADPPMQSSCDEGRVRKDAADLTADEKAAYVDAIHQLKATVSPWDVRYTWYDQFVRWHQMAVVLSAELTGGIGIAHHNPAFPPWHRHLLWLYESALCEVSGNPSIALPYWDWTDPRSTEATFSNDLMGPGGAPDEAYAVVEGPFNRDVWQLNILPFDETLRSRTPEKYLVRGLGLDTANIYEILLPTAADVFASLAVDTFDTAPWNVNSDGSFRNTFEGFVIDPATGLVDLDQQTMHNVVHDWVGGIFYLTTGTGELIAHQGTMEPLDVSPNDPVFFMHHANVDRLWASWQVAHPGPENYLPQGGVAECPYPNADDGGPADPQPHISDIHHILMNMRYTGDEPFPGMRLNDYMYPYCLDRYAGTMVHSNMTPAAQIEPASLGFSYASLYEVPTPEQAADTSPPTEPVEPEMDNPG